MISGKFLSFLYWISFIIWSILTLSSNGSDNFDFQIKVSVLETNHLDTFLCKYCSIHQQSVHTNLFVVRLFHLVMILYDLQCQHWFILSDISISSRWTSCTLLRWLTL